jgi:hypothetical protein
MTRPSDNDRSDNDRSYPLPYQHWCIFECSDCDPTVWLPDEPEAEERRQYGDGPCVVFVPLDECGLSPSYPWGDFCPRCGAYGSMSERGTVVELQATWVNPRALAEGA